jgi:cytochrome P450/NADPH-cytochrome P450 reductase
MMLQNFNFDMADPLYILRFKEAITINPTDFKIRARLRDRGRYQGLLEARSPDSELLSSAAGEIRLPAKDSEGNPLSVLYGSDNGASESLAYRFSREAITRGFDAEVQDLNARKETVPTDRPVIIICSSYNGVPPHNARQFVSWLESLSGSEMKNVKYAVFGCGKLHISYICSLPSSIYKCKGNS